MDRLALIYAVGSALVGSKEIAAAVRRAGLNAQIRDARLLAAETVERADEILTMLPEDASADEQAAIAAVADRYPEHRVRPHTDAGDLLETNSRGGEASQDGEAAGNGPSSEVGRNAGPDSTDDSHKRRSSRSR